MSNNKINKVKVNKVEYDVEDALGRSIAEKAASNIGTDEITILQGNIGENGIENNSSFYLRTKKISNYFKLEVNDGYKIGFLVQYDLSGTYLATYAYGRNLDKIEWTPTKIIVTNKEYLWSAIIYKGDIPNVSIVTPEEGVVKSFLNGIYYLVQGDENDRQSVAQGTKVMIETLQNELTTALADGSFLVGKASNANTAASVGEKGVNKASLDTEVLQMVTAVDNLTTANTISPLSANQGKVLKEAIDSVREIAGGASVSYDEENEIIIVDNSGSGSTNPLRPLFLAEGALYNDTDAIIKRTAPWGTEEKWRQEEDGTYTYWEENAIIDHLPGHYYLNGIGDITEDEMIKIYNAGYCNEKESCPLGYANAERTNLGRQGMYNVTLSEQYFSLAASKLEIMNLACRKYKEGHLFGCGAYAFRDSKKLRKIIYLKFYIETARLSAFGGCINFEECWISDNKHNFKVNQSFADCPNIYKRFILSGIKYSSPTTAITITLHPDAYARIANQPDILEILKEKNGYTDESGNKVPGTLPTGASINLVSA